MNRVTTATTTANAAPSDLTYAALKDALRSAAQKDPIDALASLVLGASTLFYLAEKGKNPKVGSYADALLFITTCLSVGYADVFARTDAGKAIASVVMTFGPALSARALDAPGGERGA
jgi:voltage-gated potassium channel